MKRIVLCLFAVVLFAGIFVHDAAATSVTLLNLTQPWTGKGLSPYVVVSPTGTSYTKRFQRCSGPTCTTGFIGNVFTTPYPTGSNIIGSTPYYYKVTVTTVNANPNVTKTGIFKINPPTTTQGGGVIGTGSTGGIIWIFKGLWSGDEALTPSTAWYAPTSLSAEVIPKWSLAGITVSTYNTSENPAVWDEYVLAPLAPAVLSSGVNGELQFLSPDSTQMGWFTWDSMLTGEGFDVTFGFNILANGIPIYYADPSSSGPDVLKVRFDFTVGPDTVSIERTWAIDYTKSVFNCDPSDPGCDPNEIIVYFIETTPMPPPPLSTEPEPDNLTVLSASYIKARETRLLFGWWLHRYKLNVVNNGSTPLANVCGKVKSTSSSMKVIDPEVCFPEIPAGGSATSKGTFSFMAKSPNTSGMSWTYSSLRIETRPESLVASSEAQLLSIYVVLSTSAPKSYYVFFHQWLPEGVTVDQTVPLGWTASDAQVWKVDQNVIAPLTDPSNIRAMVWLLNTLQKAEVTVPITP